MDNIITLGNIVITKNYRMIVDEVALEIEKNGKAFYDEVHKNTSNFSLLKI